MVVHFGESLEVQLLAGAGNQPDEMVLAENYKQGTSILSMLVGINYPLYQGYN